MTPERGRSGWPATLVRIAELVGDGPALSLVAAYGGLRVYVPRRPTPSHGLVQAIGLAAATALAECHGGEELEIPLAAALKSRKRAILRATGTTREIAAALGTSERYVRMVRNAGTGDARQLALSLDPAG